MHEKEDSSEKKEFSYTMDKRKNELYRQVFNNRFNQ